MYYIRKIIDRILVNEIASKASEALLLKILGSLFGYGFLILVTRNFGADVWGMFALCLAVLQISTIISKFGIDIAILKFVAQFKELSIVKGLLFQCLFIVAFFSIGLSFCVFYFSDTIAIYFFKKPHLTSSIRLIALAITPLAITNILSQIFRGLKKIKEFAFLEYVSKFFLAIVFFLILLEFGELNGLDITLYSFLYSLLFVWFISLGYVLYNFRKIRVEYRLSKHNIIKTSYPMMLSTSIFLLMSWSDTIMLGVFSSEINVGLYNVALKIAMGTAIILGAVNSILAPKLAETFNNDRFDEFKQLIKESTRIMFLCSLPVLLFLLIFPGFCLSMFGAEFIDARNTLLILLFGQFINILSGSVGFILQMTGNEKVFQRILFYSLIINIILNYFFINMYGIEGAAIASVLSMTFWNLSSVVFVYKKYNILTIFSFGNNQ